MPDKQELIDGLRELGHTDMAGLLAEREATRVEQPAPKQTTADEKFLAELKAAAARPWTSSRGLLEG